jgi:hypothetical protein
VTAVGWLTGLRAAFHGLLLLLSAAAFLPLLVVTAFVVSIVGIAVVAAFTGGADDAPDLAGAYAAGEGLWAFLRRGVVPYYRFLFGRRRPAFLGAVCGLLLGVLGLGLLVSVLVVLGEVCTLKRMAAVQQAVEEHHNRHVGYPTSADGRWAGQELLAAPPSGWPYCSAAAFGNEGSSKILLDGFSRGIRYEVAGRWPLASYRIVSSGFDGRESGDDICLGGATRARALVDHLARAAGAVHELLGSPSGETDLQKWWSALRSAGCPPGAP